LVISLSYGWGASLITLDFWSEQEAFNARSLPYGLSVSGIIISLLLILTPDDRPQWQMLGQLNWRPALLLLGLLTIYSIIFEWLGYFLATVLFLGGGFWILGQRKIHQNLMIAVPVTGIFWVVMDLLGIYLAPGEWWFWIRGQYA